MINKNLLYKEPPRLNFTIISGLEQGKHQLFHSLGLEPDPGVAKRPPEVGDNPNMPAHPRHPPVITLNKKYIEQVSLKR